MTSETQSCPAGGAGPFCQRITTQLSTMHAFWFLQPVYSALVWCAQTRGTEEIGKSQRIAQQLLAGQNLACALH